MRTFIALNLPPDERARLHASLDDVRGRVPGVRWTAADALHLTLRFLGDIEGAVVPRLDEVLGAIAARHRPLELRIGGLGGFPSLRRGAVIWVGVAPDAALMSLQEEIEADISRVGWPREQRPFRPHVTVARSRGGARPPDIARMAAEYEYGSTIRVETLDLMRSHTDPGGARYEPLLRRPLGTEAPA